MLRIMEEKAADNSTTLRLDGRVAGQWVGLLRTTCDRIFQNDGRLILDLGGVSFADLDGVQLLRQLQQQVTFINSSPFLQEQIKQTTGNRSVSQ